jgi:hypothetical protein
MIVAAVRVILNKRSTTNPSTDYDSLIFHANTQWVGANVNNCHISAENSQYKAKAGDKPVNLPL